MTKQELMETYTEEQLAEMVIEAYEREDYPKIMAININGFPKMFTIKEIEEIVTAYEEIKLCQEQNKQCKTILPSEYLKVLSLNQTVSQLQSEVEKYRKAFEGAKNELKDLEIKIEEEYKPLEIEVDRIRKNERELSEENAELHCKLQAVNTFQKGYPTEPIKVADMLINYEGEYEHNPIAKALYKEDKGTYHIFDIGELRQIAEHLLVYCNHNGEAEE